MGVGGVMMTHCQTSFSELIVTHLRDPNRMEEQSRGEGASTSEQRRVASIPAQRREGLYLSAEERDIHLRALRTWRGRGLPSAQQKNKLIRQQFVVQVQQSSTNQRSEFVVRSQS